MDVRPSPIAGRWYPDHVPTLTAMLDRFLAEAGQAPAAGAVGALVPHAGIQYSGPVAAHAFGAVRGMAFDLVAILCPSHYHDDGPMLTSTHSAYATPLGTVPVDQDAIGRLRAELAIELDLPGPSALVALRRDREHAIEIELPFLQHVLQPGFSLLPVMVRDQAAPTVRALGRCLARVLGGRALVIASSDLSHYHARAAAERLDAEMLRQVEAFDPEGVLAAQAAGRGFACGFGALAAVLWAARDLGATRARVLRHATSGDVSGDYERVVGYGAAVMVKGGE